MLITCPRYVHQRNAPIKAPDCSPTSKNIASCFPQAIAFVSGKVSPILLAQQDRLLLHIAYLMEVEFIVPKQFHHWFEAGMAGLEALLWVILDESSLHTVFLHHPSQLSPAGEWRQRRKQYLQVTNELLRRVFNS